MSARLAKAARPQEARAQEQQQRPAEQDMQRWIAEAAYYRAERRGFEPGMETDDWLAAEAEVQKQLRGGKGVS
jgi:hypothetical protein